VALDLHKGVPRIWIVAAILWVLIFGCIVIYQSPGYPHRPDPSGINNDAQLASIQSNCPRIAILEGQEAEAPLKCIELSHKNSVKEFWYSTARELAWIFLPPVLLHLMWLGGVRIFGWIKDGFRQT